jgi:hypothetical protein
MKTLFFLTVLFFSCSLSNNVIGQPAYPTGFLSSYTIFIDSGWNVVILVTCDAPHTEYCTTTPRDRTSKGLSLVENLKNSIGKTSDWEVELMESNSYSRIYKFTSKETILEEQSRFTKFNPE